MRNANITRRRALQTIASGIAGFAVGCGTVSAQPGSLRWVFDTENSVQSSPTVVDGQVFVGSWAGNVYAISKATGDEIWTFETTGSVRSSPTVVDGHVFVGSSNNNLYSIDAVSGNEEWSFSTGETRDVGGIKSSPVVSDGTVFFGNRFVRTSDAGVYAIDAATGGRKWTVRTGGSVLSSPIVDSGTVYVGANDNNLYAIDAASGDRQWVAETGGPVESSPTLYDDYIIIGSDDGKLYSIDATSGEQQWTVETGRPIKSSPTAIDGSVFFGSNDGTLRAVKATTGEEIWRYDTGATSVRSSPTVAGGSVFVGDESGEIYSIDRESGEENWSLGVDDAIRSSPTVVDGRVFVGSQANRLYALDAGVDGSSDGSRVTLGTLGHHDQIAYTEQTIAGEDTETTTGSAAEGVTESTADATSEASGESDQATPVDDAGPTGMVALGGGGAVAAVGAYALLQKRSDDSSASDDSSSSATGSRSQTSESEAANRDRSNSTEGYNQSDVSTPTLSSTEAAIPETIPSPPKLSITHDDIEKGDLLGSGGNADVYQGKIDTESGTIPLALKEPRMGGTIDTETISQLLDEAETWQQLDENHNIVSVVDYGSTPLPWIAMEYMDGGSLTQRAGEMPFEQTLWTAFSVTKGIRHAHKMGVAHLDLKPQNILFRSIDDAWDLPKVADWGLSKQLLNHSQSVEGMSPHYAAPEQFDTDAFGQTDTVTDVYQLGAVLYELFTGRPPFDGDTFEVINKIQSSDPVPPSEVADLPTGIDEILLTALSTEKGDRYEDVLYLRDALQTLWDDHQ